MMGSLSATLDQINWVLTSYIVAAAITTPLTGFAVARFGRKPIFIGSVIGFTVASVLCGLAGSLNQMVIYRLLQGVFGAPLVPLSQSVLLDSYPREKHGSAMAIWGVGVMILCAVITMTSTCICLAILLILRRKRNQFSVKTYRMHTQLTVLLVMQVRK